MVVPQLQDKAGHTDIGRSRGRRSSAWKQLVELSIRGARDGRSSVDLMGVAAVSLGA